MKAGLAGAGAVAALAVALGAGAPPPPAWAMPAPPPDWGQAVDLGHGYLVAAVSRGALGFAMESGFPWDELAACAPASAVHDPAAGPDAGTAVHRFTLEAKAGAIRVVAEHGGTPALAEGCAARALPRAVLDSPASGAAEVALEVVPRATLTGASVTAVVATRAGSAADRSAIVGAVLAAVEYCRDRFGIDTADHPVTGRVDVKLVTRGDLVLSFAVAPSAFVTPAAAKCVADASKSPSPPPSKLKRENAEVTVRFIAGGRLVADAPERLGERLVAWSRAMTWLRAHGE